MADRYIDSTFINAHLGSAYATAATAITGVVENTLIESATSLIQSAMRNSGYSPPSTQDPSTVEEIVKLGTLGAFRELLAGVPEASIPLPENWDTNPAKVAYAQIISGDMQLAATPSQIGAVGGMRFTEADPDVDDSNPRRTTREELSGW